MTLQYFIVAVTVVSPHMGKHGWPFKNADPSWKDADDDAEHPNFQYIKDLYFLADQNYGGRYLRLFFSHPVFLASSMIHD